MYELMNVYLENGLKVVLHRIPTSKTIACGVWVKQGSRYEDDSTSGLSHLLEHLIFTSNNNEGTENLLDEIASKGIVYNATTTKEYTHYYFSGISYNLGFCISTLAKLLTQYNDVSDEKFENEKKIVLREASSYYSSFKQIAERSTQALWGNSNVGRIIVGDMKVIENSTRESIVNLYNKSYTPENSILVIVGGFEYHEAIELAKKNFASWEDKIINRNEELVNKEVGIYLNTQKTGDNSIVSVCFKLPEFDSPYRNTIEVISLILGDGGIKSRLAKEIRMKRGLAYIINSFESFYEERGLLGFASVCQPKTINEVVELMIKEFSKCKKEGFTKNEIESAKNKLITKRILGIENVADHLKFLGKCATYNSSFSLEQEIRNIKKISGEHIMLILDDIFHENNMSIAAIGDINIDELLERIKLV